MAVKTKHTFPAANGSTSAFSSHGIELNNLDDLDVYVTLSGGTRVLMSRSASDTTSTSSHPQYNDTTGLYFPPVAVGTQLYNYQLSAANDTITFNQNIPNLGVVSVERRTRDGSGEYTTFAGGSTLRAVDLNAANKESNFTAQEARNKSFDLERQVFSHGDGNFRILEDKSLIFEGATDNAHETTLTVADPTADRTITFPDRTGTVITSADSQTVTSTMIADGTIQRGDLAGDLIDGTKIENDAVDSEHIAADSLDTEHYAPASVDATALGSNSETTGKILNNNVTMDKLGSGTLPSDIVVNEDNLAANSVGSSELANNAVDTAAIQDNAVTADKIADEVIVLTSEHAASTPNDVSFFTTSASDARYFRQDSTETISSGDTWSSSNSRIATTAAIDAQIANLVDEVGGFVAINNEGSFPNAHPDIKNDAGTIVSIMALNSAITTGSGVTTHTLANGRNDNGAVVINGLTASTTYPAGFGMLVLTTTTAHTYTFHRLVPKATEVNTVASNIGNVNNTGGSIANVNTVGGAIANVNTVAGIASNVTAVASNATNINAVNANSTNINAVVANATNINAVAADATDIGTVAGKATEIGRLGTADAVADMNTLGTADVVADLNTLATADVVADMNTLATADIVADMNTLATTSNVNNMNTVAGAITNVNTTATNITHVTNCSTNISDVHNYADLYQVGTSAPTTRADSSALTAGDMWFDSSSNKELKVHNGTSYQLVTPSQSVLDDIAIVSGNITFTEDLGLITGALTTGTGDSIDTCATNIARIQALGATAVVADMALLATTDCIADMAVLGTADVVSDLNTLATADVVSDMNTLAVTDVVNDMNTLATTSNVNNMNTVAGISSNVTTVAGISANVTTAANNNANITTVAGNNTNINTVAGNNSNISTVAGVSGNVTTVAGIAANVTTAATNNANITTVAGSIANVNTTAGAVGNVNNVGNNIASVNTVSGQIANVNRYADEYTISSSTPGSPDEGDLWYNSTGNTLNYYNGSSWVGISPGIAAIVSDSSPQLGGHLNANSKNITNGAAFTATTFNGDLNGTINTATTAATQTTGDNTTKVATTAFVKAALDALVDSAPGTLNTLNELAAALGDDSNYAATTTASLNTKAPLASPTFTGTVTAGTITGSNLQLDFGTL